MLTQRRLAASVLKCSPQKVVFDQTKLSDIKEAITKEDIKGLIADGVIQRKKVNHQSKARARVRKVQRSKGRQRGSGSRKGSSNARLSKKSRWMGRIRLQRKVLKELRENKEISQETYRELYMKSKGGFFRSKRHLELYITEHKLRVK